MQKDIADALLKVYAIEDYETIMAMVALRIIRPGLALNNYQTQYLSSWVSKFWPYAKLSPKVAKKFVTHLGMRPDCFQMVFADLLNNAAAASHHIMIDGFLLPSISSSDPLELALFQHDLNSHTNRVVMYVSDVESKDLLGAVTFLQDDVNASAYNFFLWNQKVSQGVIVADKDFAVQELKPLLEANPDLHYLAPVARDSEVVKQLELLAFDQFFTVGERGVFARKVQAAPDLFYYAYKSPERAEQDISRNFELVRAKLLEVKDFFAQEKQCGNLVFVSDCDLPVATIWEHYANRCELESLFAAFPDTPDLDKSDELYSFVLMGNEFLNVLALSIQWRLAHKFSQLSQSYGVMSYQERMLLLTEVLRRDDAPLREASRNDGTWTSLNMQTFEAFVLMEQLQLLTPVDAEPASAATSVVAPQSKARRSQGSKRKKLLEREGEQ